MGYINDGDFRECCTKHFVQNTSVLCNVERLAEYTASNVCRLELLGVRQVREECLC